MKRFALIILLLAAFPAAGRQGEEAVLRAEPDRTSLTVGEHLELNVSLEGPDVSSMASFDMPDMPPQLRVIRAGVPSTQFSTQIINGRVSKYGKISVSYLIEARAPGRAVIPPVKFRLGSRLLSTEPVVINISEPRTASEAAGDTAWKPPSDPYLQITLDKDEAYVGEQVMASWYLYYQKRFAEAGIAQVPTAGDFMVHDLGTVSSLNPVTKVFGNEKWNAAYIKGMALFPIQAGTAVVEPLVLTVQVSSDRIDFFGRMMAGRTRVQSEPLKLTVKPLPEEGRPANFSGATGNFEITLDRTSGRLKTNEQFKFNITVRGTGHPDLIPKPEIELPPGIEIYTEAVEKKVREEGGKVIGSRLFSMILVPRQEGNYTLEPFEFSYFDPQTESYRVARSPRISLQVEKGQAITASPAYGQGPAFSSMGQDLRYIKPDREELAEKGSILFTPAAAGLQALPVFALAAAWLWRKRRERLSRDPAYARTLRAGRRSRKFIAQARKAAEQGDAGLAYAQAYRAVTGFIGDRTNRPDEGMTAAEAAEVLEKAGASDDTVARVSKFLSECDRARYAPGAASEQDPRKIAEIAAELVRILDRETGR